MNTEGGKMGAKSDDSSMVAGCSDCHAYIDRRANMQGEDLATTEEILFYTRRALTRTYRQLFDEGVLKC